MKTNHVKRWTVFAEFSSRKYMTLVRAVDGKRCMVQVSMLEEYVKWQGISQVIAILPSIVAKIAKRETRKKVVDTEPRNR